jgi:hypothetical protein
MMTHLTQRALKLVALLIVSVALCSSAYADRRTSLMGNTLIKDRDDTFLFPQTALKYNNSLSLDYAATPTQGNALLIAGPHKNMALGVALHRGDLASPLGGMISLDGSAEGRAITGPQSAAEALYGEELATPFPIADLIYAAKMGGNNVGFRLGFLGGGSTVDPDLDLSTDPDNLQSSGSNLFGVRVSAGLSMGATDLVLDLSSETAETLLDDKATKRISITNVHAGARHFMGKGTFKLGLLADLNYMSASSEELDKRDNPADERSMFNGFVGFGPVYRTEDKRLRVAFYASAAMMNLSRDPDTTESNDQQSGQIVMFPGFNMAMEYKLKEWLFFRSGVRSDFAFASGTTKTNLPDGSVVNVDSSGRGELAGFMWNAGLGFVFDRFTLNATLSNDLLLKGPYFLSGNSTESGLFSTLAAIVQF